MTPASIAQLAIDRILADPKVARDLKPESEPDEDDGA